MRLFFDLERPEVAAITDRPYRATQTFKSVYQRWVEDFEEMIVLPKSTRADLASELSIKPPSIHRRFQSVDGTRRYLVRLSDGELAESVFIPEEGRSTFCISSQVGCALACSFCLTGLLGLQRNLTAGEIVGQVVLVQRDNLPHASKNTFNIVLMGMGEPLHNYHNVMKAIRIMNDPQGLNMSMARITLSTAGLLPGIERLGKEPLIPNLAISLTGVTDQKRNTLMPINLKYPIDTLLEAIRKFPINHRKRVMFEYVLIKDITDDPEDAFRLVRLLKGMRAKVNLIPFNESDELPYRRPSDETILRFQAVLIDHHITTFVRKNRGNDISAACGMLRKKETWSVQEARSQEPEVRIGK